MPIDNLRLSRWFGERLGRPVHWLYVGLLTGVFECGATWIFVAKTRVRRASWDQAVAFGLGFGTVEAFLVGIVQLLAIAAAILFPGRLRALPAKKDRAFKMIRPGDWVILVSLPPWVSSLPSESQRVFEFCVGRAYRVDEVDDSGHLVLDVSADIDTRFGGFMNDVRVEPEYVKKADIAKPK